MGDLKISVVVPVLDQSFLTSKLLEYIYLNSVKPHEIFLIDNNSTEDIKSIAESYPDLNIIYLRQSTNIGVNAAWNIGIEKCKGDLISFLNNDIIIPKFFFKYITELMTKRTEIGICVPNTVSGKVDVLTIESYPYIKTVPLGKREGWAFTMRSLIAKECYPIPTKVKLFFGDDYLFGKTRDMGNTIVKMISNPIYHYGSITLLSTLGESKIWETLRRERRIWEGKKK